MPTLEHQRDNILIFSRYCSPFFRNNKNYDLTISLYSAAHYGFVTLMGKDSSVPKDLSRRDGLEGQQPVQHCRLILAQWQNKPRDARRSITIFGVTYPAIRAGLGNDPSPHFPLQRVAAVATGARDITTRR